MKIDKLIDDLAQMGACVDFPAHEIVGEAAEVIMLLWEIAQDTSNSEYRKLIDEMRGDNT